MQKTITRLLLASLTSSLAGAQCVFTITGEAEVTDSVQVGFVPPGAGVCNTYFDCSSSLIWCTDPVVCHPGDSAQVLAAALTAAINATASGCGVNPGYGAALSGTTITVAGPGGFDCCLTSGEMGACGPGVAALLVDGCTINNVCDGVGCNEAMPRVKAHTFTSMPTGGLIGTNYCSPNVPNSTGFPGTLSAMGSTSASAMDVELQAGSLPSNQFGYFIASRTQGFVAMPGNSSGNLCVLGSQARYNAPSQIGSTGAGGSFSLQVGDINVPTNPAPGETISPGDTWNWQCWYRDVGNTNNFTEGLNITFQ